MISHSIDKMCARLNASSPSSFSWVSTMHFIFAVILFSPFFFSGEFLVASTDNYFYIFPNLIFNLRDFQHGNFFPWNRYLLAGVDFSSSHYSFLYSPLYWLIYVFPEKYFFPVFTVLHFVMVWLLGVFAYLFFREETGDKKWAFFASTAYQIGGQLFFSLNMYPYFVGYFLSTVIVYLIWTFHKRPSYQSYLFLTICFVTMFLSCHVIRVFTLMGMIMVLFIYRCWPDFKNPFRLTARKMIFFLSLLTTVLIASIRLIPLVMDSRSSDRLMTSYSFFAKAFNHFYYFLGAFIPEFFGVKFNWQGFSGLMPWAYAFSLTYYGVIPALLVVYAVIRTNKQTLFWVIFLFVALSYQLLLPPVFPFISLLLYPVYHAFMLKIWAPLAFCMLIAYGGKYLERDIQAKDHSWWLSLVFGIVASFFIIASYTLYQKHMGMAKLGLLVVVAIAVLSNIRNKKFQTGFLYGGFLLLSVLTIVVGPLLVGLRWHQAHLTTTFWLSLLYLLASIFFIILLNSATIAATVVNRKDEATSKINIGLLFVAMVLFAIPLKRMNDFPGPAENFILSLFGFSRMMLLFIFIILLIRLVKLKQASLGIFFPLLLSAVLIDVIPYDKINSNVVTPAFWSYEHLQYPTQLKTFVRDIVNGVAKHESGPTGNNMISNGSFELWGKNPVDWSPSSFKGGLPQLEKGEIKLFGKYSLAIKTSIGGGVVYADLRDLRKNDLSSGTPVSFGAWVKSSKPKSIRVMLTDKKSASWSEYHSGSGDWEWLSGKVSMSNENPKNNILRFHIWADSEGDYHVDDVIVYKGSKLPPFYGYPDRERFQDLITKYFIPETFRAPVLLNLKKFRFAAPSETFVNMGKYGYVHIAQLYGIPSFGGVNGFRSPYFLALNKFFVSPDDILPGDGGQTEYLSNPRFLDIMGCGYEPGKDGVVERKGSLSRFMLFTDVEVIGDNTAVLKRLKDPNFAPRKTVILSDDPGVNLMPGNEGAMDLDYDEVNSNLIKMKVSTDKNAVLFFNDSYDDGWEVKVNGKRQPVLRADYNFMATVIPSGDNNIVWRFRPSDFIPRVALTGTGLLLLISITGILFLKKRRSAA